MVKQTAAYKPRRESQWREFSSKVTSPGASKETVKKVRASAVKNAGRTPTGRLSRTREGTSKGTPSTRTKTILGQPTKGTKRHTNIRKVKIPEKDTRKEYPNAPPPRKTSYGYGSAKITKKNLPSRPKSSKHKVGTHKAGTKIPGL